MPVIENMPEDVYHADYSRVSHSHMKTYREDPAKYHQMASGLLVTEETEALLLGRLLHAVVLEEKPLESLAFVKPESASKDAKAESAAKEAAGFVMLTARQYALVTAWAKAIAESEMAQAHLAGTRREVTLHWDDARSGLACKARLDALGVRIIDIKTADDPTAEAFAKACATYDYHGQAAHYIDGAKACGLGVLAFRFIVVGKKAPHTVCVYQLDNRALEFARNRNAETLYRMSKSERLKLWRVPESLAPMEIQLPKWAFYQGEYDL